MTDQNPIQKAMAKLQRMPESPPRDLALDYLFPVLQEVFEYFEERINLLETFGSADGDYPDYENFEVFLKEALYVTNGMSKLIDLVMVKSGWFGEDKKLDEKKAGPQVLQALSDLGPRTAAVMAEMMSMLEDGIEDDGDDDGDGDGDGDEVPPELLEPPTTKPEPELELEAEAPPPAAPVTTPEPAEAANE